MFNTAPMRSPYSTYKQTAVETATPEKLIVMLFNGGIKFANQARQSILDKDLEMANNYLLKVQDILTELMVTLDMDNGGDIAQNLYQLYAFYLNEVIMANIKKDAERLEPVLEFLVSFRDVWMEATKQIRMGAR